MRQAGTIRERIFQALIKRYQADGEEALVKIDALMRDKGVGDKGKKEGDLIEVVLSVLVLYTGENEKEEIKI
jgi:hypothetical protein